MLRFIFLSFIFFVSFANAKPNVVLLLADDLGWHDVGFNGEDYYQSPNLDRLCADGMRFTRAYAGGPNCLPTRACLISGMYTPRTQIWTPGGKSKGNAKHMRLAVPGPSGKGSTFPSNIALGPEVVSIADVLKPEGYKTARFGKWHVGSNDTQGFDISDQSGKGGNLGAKFYGNVDVAEWLTDAAVKFIGDQAERKQPFLLYVSHWDVHTPIRARKDVVARHAERKQANPDWAGNKKKHPTYAAMIEAVDQSAARLQAALAEHGLDDNTLFVFSSDNGGHAGITENRPLNGAKGSLYEGGVRVPTFMRWPNTVVAKSQCDIPITSVDFLPTFAELAGATLPTSQPVDGVSIVDLLKERTGGAATMERSIFWHYPLYLQTSGLPVEPVFGTKNMVWRGIPASSMVKGDWKLIHAFEDDSLRLFDLKSDIGETNNLAQSRPELAQKLFAELKAWQKDVKALIPTERYAGFDPEAQTAPKKKGKGKNRGKAKEPAK